MVLHAEGVWRAKSIFTRPAKGPLSFTATATLDPCGDDCGGRRFSSATFRPAFSASSRSVLSSSALAASGSDRGIGWESSHATAGRRISPRSIHPLLSAISVRVAVMAFRRPVLACRNARKPSRFTARKSAPQRSRRSLFSLGASLLMVWKDCGPRPSRSGRCSFRQAGAVRPSIHIPAAGGSS